MSLSPQGASEKWSSPPVSSLKRTNCVTVLTPFDLQGLRLKFVSPWRLHAVSLNPASLTHYLFNVGLSVLVCE